MPDIRKSWEVCGRKKMAEIEVDSEGSVNDMAMFDNNEIIEIMEAYGGEEAAQHFLNR